MKNKFELPKESETEIHENIAKYLNLVIRRPSRWHTVEVSNQASGKAAMLRQMALKRRGVVTGWPDIEIIYKVDNSFRILFLEVKNADGSLTEKQKALHHELIEDGHDVYVVRSVNDVENALRNIGLIS